MKNDSLLSNQKGQAILETLIVFPVLIATVSLFLSSLFLITTVVLIQNRVDETLVCLSYRHQAICEQQMLRFLTQTGLGKWNIRTSFLKQGSLWIGRAQIAKPWGEHFVINRTLETPLSKNIE